MTTNDDEKLAAAHGMTVDEMKAYQAAESLDGPERKEMLMAH
jgi:hypothetical protein